MKVSSSKGVSHLFKPEEHQTLFHDGTSPEKEEDLKGILELTKKIAVLGERQKIHPNINVSVSTLVPKPHTPFQWESQIPLEEMKEKLHFIRDG